MSIFDDLFGTSTGQTTQTAVANSSIPGQGATVQNAIDEASRLYNRGPADYYGGTQVAPFSQDTLTGMDMIRQNASDPNSLMSQTSSQLGDMITGDPSGRNPYLEQAIQGGFDKARTGIDAQFGASGRYGSGLHKQGLGESYGNIAANTLAKDYESGQNRKLVAMGLAPGVQNFNAQSLGQIGGMQEQLAQDMINADMSKWQYNANKDDDALARYMNLLGGGYGIGSGESTTTSQTPYYINDTANTLGTVIGGADLVQDIYGDTLWKDLYSGISSVGGGIMDAFGF